MYSVSDASLSGSGVTGTRRESRHSRTDDAILGTTVRKRGFSRLRCKSAETSTAKNRGLTERDGRRLRDDGGDGAASVGKLEPAPELPGTQGEVKIRRSRFPRGVETDELGVRMIVAMKAEDGGEDRLFESHVTARDA